jgi:AmmeMemoRadiSam system protein B
MLVGTLSRALRDILAPVMENTLLVVSFNMVVHRGEEDALNMAWECFKLLSAGKNSELCNALQSGRIESCGGALIAALLKSGLMDAYNPEPASPSIQSTAGENGKTVYYGAFSFK